MLLKRISQRLAALGITSVMDAALTSEHIEDFARAAALNPLDFRMTAAFFADFEAYRPSIDQPINVDALLNELLKMQQRVADTDNLKVDSAKIFIDGLLRAIPSQHRPHCPMLQR